VHREKVRPAEQNLPLLRSTVSLAKKIGLRLGGGQKLLRALPTESQGKVMTTLRIILGDQLNPEHGWF